MGLESKQRPFAMPNVYPAIALHVFWPGFSMISRNLDVTWPAQSGPVMMAQQGCRGWWSVKRILQALKSP